MNNYYSAFTNFPLSCACVHKSWDEHTQKNQTPIKHSKNNQTLTTLFLSIVENFTRLLRPSICDRIFTSSDFLRMTLRSLFSSSKTSCFLFFSRFSSLPSQRLALASRSLVPPDIRPFFWNRTPSRETACDNQTSKPVVIPRFFTELWNAWTEIKSTVFS